MKNYIIRPGTAVECVLADDDLDKKTEVRKALIYDATDNEIIVSQTNPPLFHSSMGKMMSLTYIDKKKDRRLGLSGVIEKIIKEYRASQTKVVSAILLKNITRIKSLNLRYSYRVRPPADYKIDLIMGKDKELQLIDLSASGIKFSHRQENLIDAGQEITLSISIKGKVYDLKARVIRKEKGNKIGSKQFELVAAQFMEFDKSLEDELAREIREIERYIRFNGVI